MPEIDKFPEACGKSRLGFIQARRPGTNIPGELREALFFGDISNFRRVYLFSAARLGRPRARWPGKNLKSPQAAISSSPGIKKKEF